MDKPIEPADVEVDSLGVRLHILKGYWATLTPVRARALAYKILGAWPESPSIAEAAAEKAKRTGDLFYSCMFCGCETNAFERACCELGQAKDRNRVTIEQMVRWEEEAESWCKSSQLVLVRLVAGRVLLLLDEIVRLRRGPPKCAHCSRPATCFGSYENSDPGFACSTCCGHGNEDGHCVPATREACNAAD